MLILQNNLLKISKIKADFFLFAFTHIQMLNYNLHLGHRRNHYNNYLLNFYISHIRINMEIINLSITSIRLRSALHYIVSVTQNRGYVVFFNNVLGYQLELGKLSVPLKKYTINMAYKPGIFTNFRNVKKHYENFRNIKNIPSGIFIPQNFNTYFLANESNLLGIPSIGLIDSSYFRGSYYYEIPGNDRSFVSVRFLAHLFVNSVRLGLIRRRLKMKLNLLKAIII